MSSKNPHESFDVEAIATLVRTRIDTGAYRVTQHAQVEMAEEGYKLDDVLHALRKGRVLENYPEHKRGACCLITGNTPEGRPVHVVCTSANPILVLITVYEPKLPKWKTPTERNR